MQLRVYLLAAGVRCCRRLRTRLVGERLRASAGVCQGRLVGRNGSIRCILEALCFGKVGVDVAAARF